jgi:hypothetical protein
MREILSLFSTTFKDEGYSPSPTGTWQLVFSPPRKEVYMSTSSVTCHPHLSACSQTLPMASFSQIELIAHIFFQLSSRSPFPSLLGRVFSPFYYLVDAPSLCPPNYLISFLPRQGCVGLNPNLWSGLEALQMGTLHHLLINS